MHTPILCQCGRAVGIYAQIFKLECEERMRRIPQDEIIAPQFRHIVSDANDGIDVKSIMEAIGVHDSCCRITIMTALEYKNQ